MKIESKFKIGDRVVYTAEYGYGSGIVKRCDSNNSVVVEFDIKIGGDRGHTCCGLCKPGHGWYCFEDDLTLEHNKGEQNVFSK